MSWVQNSKCRIILDLHFPEWDPSILSRADAEEVADTMARANVDCVLLYAKCHNGNSYYPTRVGHQSAVLDGRDWFGECVEAVRKRGIIPIAYYSVVWDKCVAGEHPDWVMRGPQGSPLDDPMWWAYICYTNQGYRDMVMGQIREIAENYPVEGFWLDMLIFDSLVVSCYCDNCQRLFRERTGQSIPATPTWDATWREFLEFRYSILEEFGKEATATAKAVNPKLTAVFNYHGYSNWSWKTSHRPLQHSMFNSYATGECGFEGRGIGYLGVHSRFLRAIPLEQPFEVLDSRGFGHYYTLKSTEVLKLEAFSALANGGAFTVIDQPFHDGKLCQVTYDRLGEVYGEARRKWEYFGGVSAKEVGVYFSAKSRDLYGKSEMGRYVMEFHGVCRSLIDSHFSVDILLDENLSLDTLKQYPVVWLPEAACMSHEEAQVFARYVDEGGNLVATHLTSLRDELGDERPDFALSEVLGARYGGQAATEVNYVHVVDEQMGEGIDPRLPLQCHGPGAVVSPTNGARAWGDLRISFHEREPGHFFSHNAHPPGERVGPLGMVNRYGKGKAVYLATALGTTYSSGDRMVEHRLLARNVTRSLLSSREIEVSAPDWVDVAVMHQPDKSRTIVHFTAGILTPRINTPWEECGRPVASSPVIDAPPTYQAGVEINVPFASVRGVDAQARMVDSNRVEVTVASTHAMLVIEKGGQRE